jgi:7-cyano-7-deazaguanine reductase
MQGSSLLCPISREKIRTGNDITSDIFTGFDLWTCYETSFLNESGYPVSGILRIMFSCSTTNVVDSKSLQSYLDSFNFVKITGDHLHNGIDNFIKIVREDITEKVAPCNVSFIPLGGFANIHINTPFNNGYTELKFSDEPITKFTESPDLLKLLYTDNRISKFYYGGLRMIDKTSNQSDFADIYIDYVGGLSLQPESLLKYLISLRTEHLSREETVEMIYKRLYDLNDGNFTDLQVSAFFARRNGAVVSPVRYFPGGHFSNLIEQNIKEDFYLFRTLKQ